ncbi:MAG: hypothetical protein NZ914_07215 [Gemmatales bacterium]|nr:hypothetical protein [Gemmatales bacterium]
MRGYDLNLPGAASGRTTIRYWGYHPLPLKVVKIFNDDWRLTYDVDSKSLLLRCHGDWATVLEVGYVCYRDRLEIMRANFRWEFLHGS